jgi:hypothetical protein
METMATNIEGPWVSRKTTKGHVLSNQGTSNMLLVSAFAEDSKWDCCDLKLH